MLPRLVLAATAAIGLSACVDGPQTASEFRTAAGGAFGQKKVATTSRSLSAVTASLRSGAAKCMNRSVTNRSVTPGSVSVYTVDYKATVTASGGRTELSLYQSVRGNLPQPNGVSFVADAVPAAGGTQITMYGGRFGYGDTFAAVEQWAKGGAIVCPDLPWTE